MDAYRYPVEWATEKVALPIPTATFMPTVPINKRHFEAEKFHSDEDPVGVDTHDMPLQKRARGTTSNEILRAKGSVAGSRHKPVARFPKTRTSNKPKEAGRGAERLATPNTQGIRR